MPVQFSKVSSLIPVSTIADQPTLTDQELTTELKKILEDGLKNNHDPGYSSDQIYQLSQDNPNWANKHHLNDYQAIKESVKRMQEFNGNLPVVFSGVDELFLATIAAKTKGNKVFKFTEEDKKTIQNVKRDVLIGATIATGSALGVPLAQVAIRTWQTLVGAAATPQGQEIIKDTVSCVESLVDGTPPPAVPKAAECFLVKTAKESLQFIYENTSSLIKSQ